MQKYDVVIVGAGPAGIFTALELAETKKKTLLIDKGKLLDKRVCYQKEKCLFCQPCNMTCGWGGSGAFSDGKLLITDKVGGWLGEYLRPKDYRELILEAEKLWLKHGAPKKVYGIQDGELDQLVKEAKRINLEIVTYPIRHMGSDGGKIILNNIYRCLKTKIDITLNTEVSDIIVKNKRIKGVILKNGEKIFCQTVVIAPGRAGADWLLKLAQKNHLATECNVVDLGVRVEIPSKIFSAIAAKLYELKVYYKTKSFNDKVRTFCVCPNGEVTIEHLGGDFPVQTVNGHSLVNIKTNKTNFALLVSTKFTDPFKDPICYAKSIARLANVLSRGVMVQRLKDLVLNQRSTTARIKMGKIKPSLKSAVPGDLSFVLPHRYITDILETLQALDRIIPGIWDSSTLLYGVEIKLYSSRIKVNKNLETKINNLFVAGDGAGLTRGLIHASVSGLAIAGEIKKR